MLSLPLVPILSDTPKSNKSSKKVKVSRGSTVTTTGITQAAACLHVVKLNTVGGQCCTPPLILPAYGKLYQITTLCSFLFNFNGEMMMTWGQKCVDKRRETSSIQLMALLSPALIYHMSESGGMYVIGKQICKIKGYVTMFCGIAAVGKSTGTGIGRAD